MDRELKIQEKKEQELENQECTFHPKLNSNTLRVFR